MCPPAVMLAITVASAVASHAAQQSAAKAQNQASEENAREARANAVNGYEQVSRRQNQEREAAAAASHDAAIQTMQQEATARVQTGEAGIAGISVDSLLTDITGAGARTQDQLATNYLANNHQLEQEKKSIRAGAQSSINSVRKVAGPSRIGLGLGIARAATSSYGSYQSATAGMGASTPSYGGYLMGN